MARYSSEFFKELSSSISKEIELKKYLASLSDESEIIFVNYKDDNLLLIVDSKPTKNKGGRLLE